jgi:hypothetical protein
MIVELPDYVYCRNCQAVRPYRISGDEICCEDCHWIVATFHETLPGGARRDAWIPDADHINALPEPVRAYVHDLATRCDPAGDTETIWSQREQIGGLTTRLKELGDIVAQSRKEA